MPLLITDRYEVLELLGQGGMGRVWKARDRMLQRDVAVKEIVPPPGLTDQARQELRLRSLREARAIARLDHVNAVKVYDVLLGADGDPQIVMEYVPSRSLHDAITADGPVPPRRAAEIGLAVLGALRAAHRAGIAHRDVKPANILIGIDGRIVLTDFGLATAVEDVNLTLTGVVLGSPAYVSPERAMRGTVGPEGDLWSLGATLFAAVEGQSPYARPSSMMSLTALATEPPPPARHAGPLTPVIEGLLRKDPAERIDADTAERLLRAVLAGPATALPPAPIPTRAPAPTSAPTPAPAPIPALTPDPAPAALDAAEPSASVRRRRRSWLVAALSVLLPLGLVIGIPLAGHRAPRTTSDADLVGPPESSGPSTEATYSAPPAADGSRPLTWSVYRDSSGFTVPAPRDWRIVRRDRQVEFHEPGGERMLTVGPVDTPGGDPVGVLTSQEKDPAIGGRLRGYHRVEIAAVNYQLRAADWEWVHTGAGGIVLHVRQRVFTTSTQQSYRIVWTTPDADWPANADAFQRVTAGFRPAAPPASGGLATLTPGGTGAPKSSMTPTRSGYQLVGAASGRCLDISDPASPDPVALRIWDCRDDRGRNQLWTFGSDRSVRLGGRCLDVLNASSDEGAAIQLTTCNTTPAQQFTLNDRRQLVNAHSGMCLAVVGAGTANGASIEQRACASGAPHQQWSRR
ncbi:Serine/threonine protein kinase [Micromonospora krabiensis]|uniref:non-specific serine/threonine protein kinase n=1 Tax=Micromonospora krabiensis TaxID=307121 RepID=A0A1C3N346_9ACTN|nr:Serine/threonine protein kinase [Micromonospora krabiensis]